MKKQTKTTAVTSTNRCVTLYCQHDTNSLLTKPILGQGYFLFYFLRRAYRFPKCFLASEAGFFACCLLLLFVCLFSFIVLVRGVRFHCKAVSKQNS